MASDGPAPADEAGASPKGHPPKDKEKERSLRHRVLRTARKFGPFTLIVVLLFGIKYFLLSIHVSVHSMKNSIQEQCEVLGVGFQRARDATKNDAWTQFRMVGRGTYGFVQWTGYRTSASEVMAVGFGAVALRDQRQVSTCAWHGMDGKSMPGEPKILYPEDKTDSYQYEPIILSCTISGKVATSLGGHVTVTLDKEHMVVYRELPNAPERSAAMPKHKACFCTYPVTEAVDGERLREWLDIHKFIGADHVIAYDGGGLDRTSTAHLSRYVASQFLEITPMREIAQYDIKASGKVVAMHDCLFRTAVTSEWTLFLDWDDVLMMQSPRFLSILLEDHRDTPWLSYGTRIFGTKKCLAAADVPGSERGFHGTASGKVPFPYERMVFHWPHFLCNGDDNSEKDKCPGDPGMRYLIVNPSKVTLLREATVLSPAEGGVLLSAEDVRHDRFEGIHKEGIQDKWCKEQHKADEDIEWWSRGMEVASLAQETRKEMQSRQGKDDLSLGRKGQEDVRR